VTDVSCRFSNCAWPKRNVQGVLAQRLGRLNRHLNNTTYENMNIRSEIRYTKEVIYGVVVVSELLLYEVGFQVDSINPLFPLKDGGARASHGAPPPALQIESAKPRVRQEEAPQRGGEAWRAGVVPRWTAHERSRWPLHGSGA
jgi:hypothetical protein